MRVQVAAEPEMAALLSGFIYSSEGALLLQLSSPMKVTMSQCNLPGWDIGSRAADLKVHEIAHAGQEIFLRRPIHYALPDEDSVTFAQVSGIAKRLPHPGSVIICDLGYLGLATKLCSSSGRAMLSGLLCIKWWRICKDQGL